MKRKIFLNHAVQEGVLFLVLSGWLIWYSLDAYAHSFNKDWSQSPSLFPLIVSAIMGVLAVTILVGGIRQANDAAKDEGRKPVQVLVVLGLSILYYIALSVIKLPYMAVSFSSFTLMLSTFEVATVVFLLALMGYLGVRSVPVLAAVPIGTTVFLSVMFRTLLHVLLP